MVFFTIISAILSGCETALTSVNYFRLQRVARLQNKGKYYNKKSDITNTNKYKHILKFVENYNGTLTTILILNTISNTAIATLGTYFFSSFILDVNISVWVATITITIVILVFCELSPKIWAKINPERYLSIFFWFLSFFVFIFTPIVALLGRVNKTPHQPLFSENELLEIVELLQKKGLLEKKEQQLIASAIRFDEKNLSSVLTPFSKVDYIMINNDYSEYKKIFSETRFSRIPIINTAGNRFIGFIHVKDIYYELIKNNDSQIKLNFHKIFHCMPFIYHDVKLDGALEALQIKNTHMMSVIHHKTKKLLGIITIEDLLEELVGEIYDEDDNIGSIHKIGQHMLIVHGTVLVKKLFHKKVKIALNKSEYHYDLFEWFIHKVPRKKWFHPFVFENYIFTMTLVHTHKKVRANHVTFKIELIF